MQPTDQKTTPLLLVRYLFHATGMVLCVIGAATFMRIRGHPENMPLYLIYGVLFLADAVMMFLCGWLIMRKRKPIFWLAAGVLGVNILLTIMDQFGMIDFLFLLSNLILLAILISARRAFAA